MRSKLGFRSRIAQSSGVEETPILPSVAKVFAAAFVGAFFFVAGLAALIFVPARSWSDETWSFAPATGEVSEPEGSEVPGECPPVDTDAAMTCQVLAPGQWLWWEEDAEQPRHHPGGRLLPPAPGMRCGYTPAGDDRLAAICRDEAGVAGAFVESSAGWRRLPDAGGLDAFVGELAPVSTPDGLVAAWDASLLVWRPRSPVVAHASPAGAHRVHHMVAGANGTVLLSARIEALDPRLLVPKALGLLVAIGAVLPLRHAFRQRRAGVAIAGVLAAIAVLGVVAWAAAMTIVGMAGGLR